MIAYLQGRLMTLTENTVLIDVGGMGYEVHCADPFVFQSSLGENITIHTYHHVREDAHLLYGFQHEDEKQLFMKLISVSGIGPKGALGILGAVDIDEFAGAVEREDDKFLTRFPGVGKKTARQIILDLKGKLDNLLSAEEPASRSESEQEGYHPTHLEEVQEALLALGYTEKEIKSVMPALREMDDKSTDEIIRKALSMMMKNS